MQKLWLKLEVLYFSKKKSERRPMKPTDCQVCYITNVIVETVQLSFVLVT